MGFNTILVPYTIFFTDLGCDQTTTNRK